MKEGMNIGLKRRDFLKTSIGVGLASKAADLNMHAEQQITAVTLREAGLEIAEFETLIASFESEHSLSGLHVITDLTFEESRRHPIREPARVALFPITAKLKTLKNETNLSQEKYLELNAKYMRLSRAVGMLNNNKVDHDR